MNLLYVAFGVRIISQDWQNRLLAIPALLLFAIASYTGPPTADDPRLMTVNTAGLLLAAVSLVIVTAIWTAKLWDGPGRVSVSLALVLMVLASAGYLINLIARFAVVFPARPHPKQP